MARAALSAIVSSTRGRVGNQVLVRSRAGTVVKARPKYKQFPHPAAAEARGRLKAASSAWNEMPLEKVVLWRAYAKTVVKFNPVDGQKYSPTAFNAFIGLATRFLQANPTGTIPLDPPTADFAGDDVIVGVEAIPGGVRFTASGANTPGVVTLLLVQTLANIRRSPTSFYKEAAVHGFQRGSPTFDLPLNPGAYAFAYRFIEAATGLSTGELLLGVVEVS